MLFILLFAIIVGFLINRNRPNGWNWPYYVTPIAVFLIINIAAYQNGNLTVGGIGVTSLFMIALCTYSEGKYYKYHAAVSLGIITLGLFV